MARPRPYDEFISTVPEFQVEPSKDFPLWFIVTCIRVECPGDGEPFMVRRDKWTFKLKTTIGNTLLKTRPCPYCFAVSRIPTKLPKLR